MDANLNTVKPKRDYHHGNLRQALLAAAEGVLRERGPVGFSLREVARRAGVSAAAPAHHFGDARGLLTALAASGFAQLERALAESSSSTEAQARAYLRFALKHPALFTLMWMQDSVDPSDPAYLAAGRAAFDRFEKVAAGRVTRSESGASAPSPRTIATWSLIHGFARLALDGAVGDDPEAMFEDVLAYLPAA